MSDDTYLPKSNLEDYPVNRDYYIPKDALDIKKTSQTWIAILRCESKYGDKTRFYKWKKNKGGEKWNVDYARMDIDEWDMDKINAFLAKK